jgi:hypothetical protein
MKKYSMYLSLGMLLLFLGTMYSVYQLGRRNERKITWFSELGQRVYGRRTYIIDSPIVCPNGKNLGQLQIDINLTNGKVRIVRNDPGLEPSCEK